MSNERKPQTSLTLVLLTIRFAPHGNARVTRHRSKIKTGERSARSFASFLCLETIQAARRKQAQAQTTLLMKEQKSQTLPPSTIHFSSNRPSIGFGQCSSPFSERVIENVIPNSIPQSNSFSFIKAPVDTEIDPTLTVLFLGFRQ